MSVEVPEGVGRPPGSRRRSLLRAAPLPPPSFDHLLLEAESGTVPLGFVQEGQAYHLVARDRAAAWPIGVLRDGYVRLRTAEGARAGTVTLVTDAAERGRILTAFRTKYGDAAYRRYYDAPARVLTVRPSSGPAGGSYDRWLESEFDNVAEDYDRHILGNRMNRLLRDRSLARLRPLFDRSHRLLEVGCGSGMETMELLRAGHEVVAVDISQRMLAVVRRKASAEGLSERLETVHARAAGLGELIPRFGAASFDGAYSTYGALNCEPDLAPLPPALAILLRPRSAFLAGVYNRWCLTELVGYSLTGQFRRAFGRRSNPIRVGSSRFCVDVFAFSPTEFGRRFRPAFRVESVEAVPLILPPSDLTSYAERFARHFATLARWDASLGSVAAFAGWGDHFLMTLRLVGDGSPGASTASAEGRTAA